MTTQPPSPWSFRQVDLASDRFRNVVLLVARDPNNGEAHALGSGFFVAGNFVMTAKHVIDEAWARLGQDTKRQFDVIAPFQMQAFQWPKGDGKLATWNVDSNWDSEFSDIALLRVLPSDEVATANFPARVDVMNVYPPAAGETVIGVGFPKTLLNHDYINLELGLHPSTATGRVTQIYEAYRDKGLLNFPCFDVATPVFGGMSGGPIFNEAGELCGIVCAGIEGYPSFSGVSLWPALFIRLTHDQNYMPVNPARCFAELARNVLPIANLEEALCRHYVVVDPDTGRHRLSLMTMEEYKSGSPAPAKQHAPHPEVFDGEPPAGFKPK
jgi:S1-C subfamily serine protease